jgi:hypothetical protein
MSTQDASSPSSAAAQAFAAYLRAGEGAVAAARRAGIRLLTSRSAVVQGAAHSHGHEHDVWLTGESSDRRVTKITRGVSAIYGVSHSALDYFCRWSRANRVFDDDIKIEGILPDGRLVISQPFVEGEVPDTKDMHRALSRTGWLLYRNSGTVWMSPDGRIVMSEVHNGNFIQQPDGSMVPIDVALHSREEWDFQLDPVEFAQAHGPEHEPQALETWLDEALGQLNAFGFPDS